jgi:hypothetical protein
MNLPTHVTVWLPICSYSLFLQPAAAAAAAVQRTQIVTNIRIEMSNLLLQLLEIQPARTHIAIVHLQVGEQIVRETSSETRKVL